ncbi:MAG: penicillin-binding protein 1A [Thermodesulfovibrionales bacterium]|nr:penicillin-binding protein 1A [Thermodesulfovibrionales bacterium]
MPLPKKIKYLFLVFFLFLCIGAAGAFYYFILAELPDIASLKSYKPLESTIIYSSDGRVLGELFVERRIFIPEDSIPPLVKLAFVAIEDQRFYSHPGIDVIGILRALYKDILAGDIVEGGSTITQQLAKMLFLTPEKSILRKIKEAIISAQIEKKYTKDEILGIYINQVYFGARAYGIEAAAQAYFGKSTFELNLAEIALLAGMPKAPSSFSPFKNPKKAFLRRQIVLNKMYENGFITKEQMQSANAEPLPQKINPRRYNAPYFVEFLRSQLESKYNEDLYTSGLKVFSTIDFYMQNIAEEAIKNGISNVEKRTGAGVQAALIAMDLRTGHIKALVGGKDFWGSQFNRAISALRQPGSAFKPFVYAVALQNGMEVEDKILDSPISFKASGKQKIWSPKNYDNKYHGYVPLRTALALSLNTATVRLANSVGIDNIIEFIQRCGIERNLDPYLPLALGASEVTLLELTSAYSVFSTGRKVLPIFYEKIVSREGITLEEVLPSSEEVISPDITEKMKMLLRSVVEEGTAQRAKDLDRKVYGKTGTTNNFSDAWFIGFDDRLVVGVWVGRDNHTPIGQKETGASAALPIWIEFMKNIP